MKVVTPRFETLASILSKAYASIAVVAATYQSLGEPVPAGAADLSREIRAHINEQRGYLERLEAVPMRQEKLELLPDPGNDAS